MASIAPPQVFHKRVYYNRKEEQGVAGMHDDIQKHKQKHSARAQGNSPIRDKKDSYIDSTRRGNNIVNSCDLLKNSDRVTVMEYGVVLLIVSWSCFGESIVKIWMR